MFVVVLAQLERQPLKKRHFVNGYVPINVALVFLMVLFFFLAPSYFCLCGNTNFLNFFFLSEQA